MTINSPCMPRICISQSTYYYREDGDSAYFVAESARKKQQATTASGPRESAWTRADQKTGSTLSWSLEQGCPFNLRSDCELFLRFQVSRCPVGVSLIVFRPHATDDSRLCCLDASDLAARQRDLTLSCMAFVHACKSNAMQQSADASIPPPVVYAVQQRLAAASAGIVWKKRSSVRPASEWRLRNQNPALIFVLTARSEELGQRRAT